MTPNKVSLPALWNMSFGFFGIQFGFGLQMANMSAIYQYLGASESDIPLLWLAAPVTGLLVQPIIGHYSDRTWTRLGRRRPYFLFGAIAASLALIAMPNSPSLWVAAGLLWVLDAAVNVSMEPFRAFVGDLLPPEQRQSGYAMQSLLIGAGAVLSSALPWILTRTGLAGHASTGAIPASVHLAFYIGAAVFLSAVAYTVVTTKEHPPTAEHIRSLDTGRGLFSEILHGLGHMPSAMKTLAVVQFFTWLGLFCLWIYFAPTIARGLFGGHPETAKEAYQRGVEWGGVCFAVYNGVAFAASFGLLALARKGVSAKTLHRIGLCCAGLGLLSVPLVRDPNLLLLSMVGVGIGWATILSMPYALLSNSIPAERMGFYMGVFNIFIVVPQILAATVLGPVVSRFLDGQSVHVITAGGVSFLLAAVVLSWVAEPRASKGEG